MHLVRARHRHSRAIVSPGSYWPSRTFAAVPQLNLHPRPLATALAHGDNLGSGAIGPSVGISLASRFELFNADVVMSRRGSSNGAADGAPTFRGRRTRTDQFSPITSSR